MALAVSDNRSRNPMCEAFVAGRVEPGYSANQDFNAAEQDGFGFYQVTQRNGRRCSSAAAYLHPVLDRPNLTVQTFAQVERILVRDGRPRASAAAGWSTVSRCAPTAR